MSDKVRIHDLAKQYGMPGKDLASKLRDFGFSKAKSHMSALDPFELVQAQGLLEANGITPEESDDDGDAEAGGLRLKRRKKSAPREEEGPESVPGLKRRKKKQPEAETPAAPAQVEPAESAPAEPVAEQPTAEQPAAQASTGEAPTGSPSTGSPSTGTPPTGTPPTGEAAPAEATADRGTTEDAAAEAIAAPVDEPEPKGRVAQAIAAKKRAEEEAAKAADATGAAPAAAETTDAPEAKSGDAAATPAAAEAAPGPSAGADAPAPEAAAAADAADKDVAAAGSSAGESPAAEAPGAEAATEPKAGDAPAASPPAAAQPAATGEAKAESAPAADAPAKKATEDPKPRGNVVGFIDPASFQQSQQRRRPDSRRLQSRDDATPDVRPTFGRDRGRGGHQAPSGPRGKMTASELREREQGRFLRRNRAAGGPPGRRSSGGRGGRGGSRDHVTESPYAGSKVTVEEPLTIAKLSEALSLKSSVVQKRALERQYGMFTLNSALDVDTATLLATEFEVELEVKQEVTAEQQLIEEVAKKRSEIEEEHLVERVPTVAFLGHVDHGKTTLIDKIRETQVADKESGGITQHIGAYKVKTSKGHEVTIVDTPGHQAFTAMRARGAKAVDIVVLVVAGDDGVKPSTEEAINHAKAAGTPIVVALNKADRPDFNANAVIQQLMGFELVPEQYGGSTAMFETSGMTGQGLDTLLEHIFLMGEVELGLRAHPDGPASGVVLEAEIQQGRGIVAHLLVQDGTLNKGDVILAGEGYGKVRQMIDDRGNQLKAAGPSQPLSVTGLDALPGVGQPFHVIETLAQAKEIATERERTNRAKMLASKGGASRELEAILGSAPKQDRETINVIVRGDVQGSVEVLRQEIEALEHDEVEVKIVHSGVGPITESDVDLATTSDAILIAFHVSVNSKARQEADRAGLTVRRYSVIYEVLDDLKRVMEGALRPEYEEEVLGQVEIRRLFKSSRIGLIAGCYVLEGVVKRNAKCRLIRDGDIVYEGAIGSLRRESEDANEVRAGFECGILLRDYRDIREGDIIEPYKLKEIKRTL